MADGGTQTARRAIGVGGSVAVGGVGAAFLESLVFASAQFDASDWFGVAVLITAFAIVLFGLIALVVGLYLATFRSSRPEGLPRGSPDPYVVVLLSGLLLVSIGAITMSIVVLAAAGRA